MYEQQQYSGVFILMEDIFYLLPLLRPEYFPPLIF